VEATAYFVVAEGLTNVVKYANASHATVRVRRHPGALEVVVADDGVGGAEMDGGSGLRGLADRVAALEGELTLDSPLGGGTRLTARIPTRPEEP
jgi:signal transduction histidine kinase